MLGICSGLCPDDCARARLSWVCLPEGAARFVEVSRTALDSANDAKSSRLNSMYWQILAASFARQCKPAIVFGGMEADTAIAICRKMFCKDSKVRNRLVLEI